MPPATHALSLNGPLSSPPQARIRVTPPLPRAVVEEQRWVLADSALRALLDEFLTRNGNRVRLSRIEIENAGPEGEALDNTHVGVEGVLLKPVDGGYERIDVSLGWSQKMGFKEGCTKTRVVAPPSGPFFNIDTGLCLTIEGLIATLKGRGRPPRFFHTIVFSFTDGKKGNPVWSIDYTRHRALFGPRREKAWVDDVTGEASFQIL